MVIIMIDKNGIVPYVNVSIGSALEGGYDYTVKNESNVTVVEIGKTSLKEPPPNKHPLISLIDGLSDAQRKSLKSSLTKEETAKLTNGSIPNDATPDELEEIKQFIDDDKLKLFITENHLLRIFPDNSNNDFRSYINSQIEKIDSGKLRVSLIGFSDGTQVSGKVVITQNTLEKGTINQWGAEESDILVGDAFIISA